MAQSKRRAQRRQTYKKKGDRFMKIDFSKQLEDFDGQPLTYDLPVKCSKHGERLQHDCEECRAQAQEDHKAPMTLLYVATNALSASYNDEQSLPAVEKHKRFNIARKINRKGKNIINVEVDDIKTIKDVIGKAYAPLVVGQCFELLEGRDPFAAEDDDEQTDEASSSLKVDASSESAGQS